MKAASYLDQEGVTEYEKERRRKYRAVAAAAMPSAVRTFSVPTTALTKAGMFEGGLFAKKKRKPGYGPLNEAQTTGLQTQYATPIMIPGAPIVPRASLPSLFGAPSAPTIPRAQAYGGYLGAQAPPVPPPTVTRPGGPTGPSGGVLTTSAQAAEATRGLGAQLAGGRVSGFGTITEPTGRTVTAAQGLAMQKRGVG